MKSGKELYYERTKLIDDAFNLKEPARVPNATRVNAFPFYEYGVTVADAMNDYDKAIDAYMRYHREFQPDVGCSIASQMSAKVLDEMGVKCLRWPGDKKGLDENSTFQYVEFATMEEDEYDEFFNDAAGFAYRKWLPRMFEVFESFAKLNYPDIVTGSYIEPLSAFTSPAIIESCKRLIRASEAQAEFRKACGRHSQMLKEEGFPSISGGGSATAFDMLGDNLRGTFGIMPDLMEQPENVKRCCEQFVKLHIEHSKMLYKLTGNPYQWVMLHKGFDYFIGDDTYAEFYWPYLRQWILALVEEGIIPVVFCEGAYNTRLKYLTDVPKGKVIYLFEEIDIYQAKKALGDTACIMGGFPVFTVTHGKKEEIVELVKEHMEVLAPGGGYIFSLSCSLDHCPRENLETLFEAVEKYGRY